VAFHRTGEHARTRQLAQPIEIYFSIVQRKVLTPNDFVSLVEVEERLLGFQQHYQQIAKPFRWTFTRSDLAKLLAKLDSRTLLSTAA